MNYGIIQALFHYSKPHYRFNKNHMRSFNSKDIDCEKNIGLFQKNIDILMTFYSLVLFSRTYFETGYIV